MRTIALAALVVVMWCAGALPAGAQGSDLRFSSDEWGVAFSYPDGWESNVEANWAGFAYEANDDIAVLAVVNDPTFADRTRAIRQAFDVMVQTTEIEISGIAVEPLDPRAIAGQEADAASFTANTSDGDAIEGRIYRLATGQRRGLFFMVATYEGAWADHEAEFEAILDSVALTAPAPGPTPRLRAGTPTLTATRAPRVTATPTAAPRQPTPAAGEGTFTKPEWGMTVAYPEGWNANDYTDAFDITLDDPRDFAELLVVEDPAYAEMSLDEMANDMAGRTVLLEVQGDVQPADPRTIAGQEAEAATFEGEELISGSVSGWVYRFTLGERTYGLMTMEGFDNEATYGIELDAMLDGLVVSEAEPPATLTPATRPTQTPATRPTWTPPAARRTPRATATVPVLNRKSG